jgi:hypothetical protein
MKQYISIVFLFIEALSAFSQQPVFEWVSQCGNPPNTTDTKTVLASGTEGQFYLAGEFIDTAQFGEKMITSSGGTDIFLAKYTAEGISLWADKIGAADYDYVQKIITSTSGNVIMSGYFYGDTQIGPDHYTSYGSQDIFIAMFNPEGTFLWSGRVGGQSADFVTGLVLDASHNIIITGYFYDSIDFGDTVLVSAGSSDIFIAKFSPEGGLLWATSAGGYSSDQSRSASCDTEGDILISGSFYYDISLGDTTLTTQNPVGVVVARYLPDGRLDRAFQLDGTYLSTENYVVADPDGGFYLTGNFSEWIHFGCQSFDAGEFDQDIYVAKYGSACENLWARQAYSASSDQVIGIIADSEGNIYLSGHYLDTIHFEQVSLPYTLCCGSREIFIVKYNSSGGVLWGQQISGARASIQSMILNAQDKLLLSGLFTEDVTFGTLTLSNFDGFHNYISALETDAYDAVADSPEIIRLNVFPNPAKDMIHIINPGHVNAYSYIIYSATGLLFTTGTLGNEMSLDISSLHPGQYLFQLIDSRSNVAGSSLFIKQ